MSLEQQIAALTNEAAALNQTFQGKVAEIDAAVAAAVAAAPNLSRTYYVDGVTGDDANAGDQAAPFATLSHALKQAKSGMFVQIVLAAGQTHVLDIDVAVVNSSVDIVADGATSSDVAGLATLTSAVTTVVDSAGVTRNNMASIFCYGARVSFKNVDVVMPAEQQVGAGWVSWGASLVMSGERHALTDVRFRRGKLVTRQGVGLVSAYGNSVTVGLVHAHIAVDPAVPAGSLVVGGNTGVASITTLGTLTIDVGASLIDVLASNIDGLSNVITNVSGTVLTR